MYGDASVGMAHTPVCHQRGSWEQVSPDLMLPDKFAQVILPDFVKVMIFQLCN